MKLLDLFCGAGGCSKGYADAGFGNIIGVDNKLIMNYPYKFIQADAIAYLSNIDPDDFDLIHASPPCQTYSSICANNSNHKHHHRYDDLLDETRKLLKSYGSNYVIENVPGAPLIDPIFLTGQMFGLLVKRKRLFETNWPINQPNNVKTYKKVIKGQLYSPVGQGGSHGDTGNYGNWALAMQINWMTKQQLTQAIPPAYTKYIGQQYFEYISNKNIDHVPNDPNGCWKV